MNLLQCINPMCHSKNCLKLKDTAKFKILQNAKIQDISVIDNEYNEYEIQLTNNYINYLKVGDEPIISGIILA